MLARFYASDRGGSIMLMLLTGTLIIVPIANLCVAESSPFHFSTLTVTLLGKYLCYALLAIALDLVWGYCGILSLGHGAFFALGGYAMGMYLMRQIGARGVYGHPELPDFMFVFSPPPLEQLDESLESLVGRLVHLRGPRRITRRIGTKPALLQAIGNVVRTVIVRID